MKVTFIKSTIGWQEHSLYVDEGCMEPLTPGVLAGLTPPDAKTVLHDDRMEIIPFDEPTDLAAITVETFTARRTYRLAGRLWREGKRVVMGGCHPTFLPEEAQEHADAIVCSDAEGVWEDLLADAEHGRLGRIYRNDNRSPNSDSTA